MSTKNINSKIEDFGEKIGGAKKENFKNKSLKIEDLKNMNEREILKFTIKDNIWQSIDYKSMVDSGIDKIVVYAIKKVKDSLPAKVNMVTFDIEKVNNYIELITNVKKSIEKIKTIDDLKNMFNIVMVENGYYIKDDSMYYGGSWSDKSKNGLIENKFIKTLQVSNYTLLKYEREIKKNNFPEGKKRESATTKKANTWERPQLANIERVGNDTRSSDATTEDFLKVFNFKGGEFGNWQNQEDRKACLNYGYDAFVDLYNTMGLESQHISLENTLSIAFGSRGSGSASAHYEPLRKVINLTKLKGAGALAHEFAHAMDDFIGTKKGIAKIRPYFTENYRSFKDDKLAEKMANLFDVIKWRPATMQENLQDNQDKINNYIKRINNQLDPIINYLLKETTRYNKESRRAATQEEQNHITELKNNITNNACQESFNKLLDLHKTIKGKLPQKEIRENIILNVNCLQFALKETEKIKNGESEGTKSTNFIKNQKKLDEMMGKSYFNTDVEIFARVFESYIQDKIESTGNKSQYLVYGTHGTPYPAGEERKLILQKMDEFLKMVRSEIFNINNDTVVVNEVIAEVIPKEEQKENTNIYTCITEPATATNENLIIQEQAENLIDISTDFIIELKLIHENLKNNNDYINKLKDYINNKNIIINDEFLKYIYVDDLKEILKNLNNIDTNNKNGSILFIDDIIEVEKETQQKEEQEQKNHTCITGQETHCRESEQDQQQEQTQKHYTIRKDIDTRDNTPLYVLKLNKTLDKQGFKNIAIQFKYLGGYYSRFKSGFIFKEDPSNKLINSNMFNNLSSEAVAV